jgi:hypothetical protein
MLTYYSRENYLPIDVQTTTLYVIYRHDLAAYEVHGSDSSQVPLRNLLADALWCVPREQLELLISDEHVNNRDILFPNHALTREPLSLEQVQELLGVDPSQVREMPLRISECMRLISSGEFNPETPDLSYIDAMTQNISLFDIERTALYIAPDINDTNQYRIHGVDHRQQDFAFRIASQDDHTRYLTTIQLLELIYETPSERRAVLFPGGVLRTESLAIDQVQDLFDINPSLELSSMSRLYVPFDFRVRSFIPVVRRPIPPSLMDNTQSERRHQFFSDSETSDSEHSHESQDLQITFNQ